MKRFGLFLLLFIFIIGLYARYIEINFFTINEYSIESEVPESFKDLKIVHFSDTLINKEFSVDDLSDLVDSINEINPDIIFFTGDLIDSSYNISDTEINTITTLLNSLEVSLYKFAVYGDNDLENEVTYSEIMDLGDFILLNNETFTLFYKDNTPITITGITDLTELENAYETEIDTSESINITLTHMPDNFSNLLSADIVFAGHYLGGYINFPFIGALIHLDGANIYYENYLNESGRLLYISNGLGTENYHVRFNNIPSINVYKFV